MAVVNIKSFMSEKGPLLGGQGVPLVLAATANRFQTVTSAGVLGSATNAFGIIAGDTGDMYGGYGIHEAGDVVRTIREGWAKIETELAVGTKIRLGAAGGLDDAGTGLIVGEVFRAAYNKGAATSNQIFIDFNMA